MSIIELRGLVSSKGFEESIAEENIVTKYPENEKKLPWKQLSIVATTTSEIVINKGSKNESTLTLEGNLTFQTNNITISSLSFKDSGVLYYFVAGY